MVFANAIKVSERWHNWKVVNLTTFTQIDCVKHSANIPLASDKELSDFLASVEKRAYKRSLYHVRNEEAALDIVQDSMMKLVEHYSGKPVDELPMLFQRIL